MTNQEFIEQVAKYVKKYAKSYGILVHSPIIAQAILESGWGKSSLSAKYHNYFGLKCGSKWTGKSVNMTTKEEYSVGTLTTIKDNFRVYDSMEEGIRGYFEFIQLARYANLKGITDPKAYLETIKADGYATSSKYVDNNYNLITQYNLTKYDEKEDNASMRTRSAVVALAQSWLGKNEADGSYKSIIDIYNSYEGTFPRGTKMSYSWAWCACTWSALAVKLGYTDIMPIEISCYYIIERAKAMGIWVENDAYVPSPGDAVIYDWDDNGIGDNTGNPDHIGTVETVNESAGTFTVIEGNYSNAVKRRTMGINGKFIRGFICPKYDATGEVPTPSYNKKSTEEIAKEVIAGRWGTGDTRKTALTNAGYDYATIQAKVNELLKSGSSTAPAKKSVDTIADEVLQGIWGNGDTRKKKLEAAGYNYSEVQNAVNRKVKGSTKSVTAVAREVIAGKWGNGSDRKKRLEAAGYNYSEVQAMVNKLL